MLYQVYEADVNDKFEFIGDALLDSDSLGECVVLSYNMSVQNPGKRFVVWQENIQALRQNCCTLDREENE